MNRKVTIIMTILLLLSTISSFVLASETELTGSNWVYDDTGSISKDTIEYINNLNSSTLKENQYAVYVTKTLPTNIDDFKLELFNEYGVGNEDSNSGILFVLAIEDREYGIEVGDGLTGQTRNKLSKDFVPKVALSELKNGDWDKAIYKISEHISEVVSTPMSEKADSTAQDEEPIRPTIFILSIFITIFIIGVPILLIKFVIWIFSEERKFFRTKEFNQYVINNNLNKKSVKAEFIDKNYDFNSNGIYNHLVSKVAQNITNNKSTQLSEYEIKSIFNYENFKLKSSAIIEFIAKEVFKKHQQIEAEKEVKRKAAEKELQEVRRLNRQWFYDEFVDYEKHTKEIIDNIASIIDNSASLMSTMDLAIDWFEMNYRIIVVENKVDEMFSDLNEDRRRIILDGIKGTEEYKNYIKGVSDTFTPTQNVVKESVYYDESVISNNLTKNGLNSKSLNPWFWLWVYGNNYNRISMKREEANRQEQARLARAARRRREESRRNSSNNSNTFGSGFGGGFSSGGGGFSGKF